MKYYTYNSFVKRCLGLVFFLSALLSGSVAVMADEESRALPINDALSLPDWLSIHLDHRVRYETVDEQFRAEGNGDDQILVNRLNLLAEVYLFDWMFGLEVLDARQAYADRSTPLTSSIVNPFDVLQAYVQWKGSDLFETGSSTTLKAGKFTMDIGSRRFVARNRFRNTMNAFTGVDFEWKRPNGEQIRAFYTLPVFRQPTEFERLLDNETKGDEQDTEVKFWGLYYMLPHSVLQQWGGQAELFYFGLDENDSHDRPTRNRDLHTLGARVYKNPVAGQFDYQFESAFQFGESRSSTAAGNRNDLDHFAHFQHAEVGYLFLSSWSPRIVAQFDYASGDKNSNDNDNEQFDTLFGARRFDFGPTGIYGPFSRSNLISPGLRLEFMPAAVVSVMLAHRGYWLAQKEDTWVAAGVRDPSGDSGHLIGQQSEIRVRWDIIPKNVQLEAGAAYLFKGRFADDAPDASQEGDSNYFYSQISFSF